MAKLLRSVSFGVLVVLLTGLNAAAQGIHMTKRAQQNPYSGFQKYAGVWGDGNYAYIGSERRNGVLIYDISNPSAPVLVSYYNPPDSFDMEDIKVANGIGYFADNFGSGLHIVDLSNPANPQLLSHITSANGGYDNAHKVAVWNNFVFIPDNLHSPAIKVFDVSNPSSPVLFTTIMTTDNQWINDMTIQDNGAGSVRLYTAGWGSKTDIWDITNLATTGAVRLGSFTSGVNGSSNYATADGNFLACTRKPTNGTGELKIYNISNPASVTLASTITMPAFGIDARAPHDPKIVGNIMFVSWFEAGTLAFDISDPYNPVFIGSYDTWPGAVSGTEPAGNWGVYPFLGLDRVLLSDRNTGLYVVDASALSSSPALYNFKLNPQTVAGPTPSTGSVFLVGLPGAGGTTVNLSANNSLVTIPASVTVPQFGNHAEFTVATNPVAVTSTSVLTAALDRNLSATLTITPVVPNGVTFAPASVVGGGSSTGTITFGAPLASDTTVTLTVTAGSAGVQSIPASVLALAGATSATFTVITKPVTASTAVKVSAAANGGTATGTLTVTPNKISAFTWAPATVVGGLNSTGTVKLTAPVTVDTPVNLAVLTGSSAVASIPSTVTILAGTLTGTFTLTTAPVASSTAIQVQASAPGTTKTATLTATANVPSALTFTPATLTGGATSTGKVSFAVPVASDTVVTLTVVTNPSAITSIPPTVTVLAGTTNATFPVVTANVLVKTTVQISAAANGGTKTATLTINPIIPSALTFTPTAVTGGASSTGKVTLTRVVPVNTDVALALVSGSAAVASMPSVVTVLAGKNAATFTLSTVTGSGPASVQVSATLNGTSKTATLTVN